MDIGGSGYKESSVYSASYPSLTANPVEIEGSTYTQSTVYKMAHSKFRPRTVTGIIRQLFKLRPSPG